MPMLTNDDIRRIGEEMCRVVEDNVMPRVEDLIEEKLEPLKTEVIGVKAAMVTKEYLDEKLARTDGKIHKLINVLEKKNVLTAAEKRVVLA